MCVPADPTLYKAVVSENPPRVNIWVAKEEVNVWESEVDSTHSKALRRRNRQILKDTEGAAKFTQARTPHMAPHSIQWFQLRCPSVLIFSIYGV